MEKIAKISSERWNSGAIIIKYKSQSFRVKISELEESVKKRFLSHNSLDWKMEGVAFFNNKGKIDIKSIIPEFLEIRRPLSLADYNPVEMPKVKYFFGVNRFLVVQRNGFLVYCAPTGQGKTYFALKNLVSLSSQFDLILYINYELSINDIKERCVKMGMNIPANIYVAPLETLEQIKSFVGEKNVCIIVDNIDNLIGGEENAFATQLNFIKELDRWLKDSGNHALILTQLVKENNINLFDKDGYISQGITTNILSGVKQLSYLARTVFMTAFSPTLTTYEYKVLKLGSATLDR